MQDMYISRVVFFGVLDKRAAKIKVKGQNINILINKMSSCVDLTKSQFEMVFVIQNIHQICIEWMHILKKRN